MLLRDQIVQQIRLDMRQLVLQRRTFEINREQVIIAARQLEQAEYNLRTVTDATQNLTFLLLQALSSVLTARNSLISTWVSYETARMSLYRDFDLMDIDANGVWTNENDPTAIDIALRHAQSAPAFSLAIPARIPISDQTSAPTARSTSTSSLEESQMWSPTPPPILSTKDRFEQENSATSPSQAVLLDQEELLLPDRRTAPAPLPRVGQPRKKGRLRRRTWALSRAWSSWE